MGLTSSRQRGLDFDVDAALARVQDLDRRWDTLTDEERAEWSRVWSRLARVPFDGIPLKEIPPSRLAAVR